MYALVVVALLLMYVHDGNIQNINIAYKYFSKKNVGTGSVFKKKK